MKSYRWCRAGRMWAIVVLAGVVLMKVAQSASGAVVSAPVSKPALDFDALNRWVRLTDQIRVGADGKYVAFSTSEGVDERETGKTLIVKATTGTWEKRFAGVHDGFFSEDGKRFIYQQADKLYILSLGTDQLETVSAVSEVMRPFCGFDPRYAEKPCGNEWLAYRLGGEGHWVALRNLLSGRVQRFESVSDFGFDRNSHGLWLATKDGENSGRKLEWLDLKSGRLAAIWISHGQADGEPGAPTVDESGRQLVFSVSIPGAHEASNAIWYYRSNMERAVEMVRAAKLGTKTGFTLAEGARFSRDGRYVFLHLRKPELPKAASDAISVDVYNYKDPDLQGKQLQHLGRRSYIAAVSVENHRVVQMEADFDTVEDGVELKDYLLVRHDEGKGGEGGQFWLREGPTYALVSLQDGHHTVVDMSFDSPRAASPDGRYLVYWSAEGYHSYDVTSHRDTVISVGVPVNLRHEDSLFTRNGERSVVGLAGWVGSSEAVLVYDEYDIWQLNLRGKSAPINLTNGWGRSHQVGFRLADDIQARYQGLSKGQSTLLVAFNRRNKNNGFYRLRLGAAGNPEELTMGPWSMDLSETGLLSSAGAFETDAGMVPLKAAAADVWVVKRSTPGEAPNYFLTRDMKHYSALTALEPQKDYNWYTEELVQFAWAGGEQGLAVLLKPEDFDPHKHYPAIVLHYEMASDTVHAYMYPNYTWGPINAAWYVSHGYLVFIPDNVNRQDGKVLDDALSAEVGAAQYLAQLPYVDGGRLGVVGHSWGGATNNYVTTHTHLFAASLSGAAGHMGVNLISNAFKDGLAEYERDLGGVSLWARPDLYVKYSSIFALDHVTTPWLIFHCKADSDNWNRSLELFTGLRRLGKKAWLLQYDNGSHVVWGRDAQDYTIRVQQFFDHYLKGAPPPKWMTEGIPARLKGVDTGLELDTSGRES